MKIITLKTEKKMIRFFLKSVIKREFFPLFFPSQKSRLNALRARGPKSIFAEKEEIKKRV